MANLCFLSLYSCKATHEIFPVQMPILNQVRMNPLIKFASVFQPVLVQETFSLKNQQTLPDASALLGAILKFCSYVKQSLCLFNLISKPLFFLNNFVSSDFTPLFLPLFSFTVLQCNLKKKKQTSKTSSFQRKRLGFK